jgi:hypothetical protein
MANKATNTRSATVVNSKQAALKTAQAQARQNINTVMTIEQLQKIVKKHDKIEKQLHVNGKHETNEEKLSRITNRSTNRSDLHAFMLIDRLVPGEKNIISAAEHDEFTLSIDLNELAKAANEQQIFELLECGLIFDFEDERAFMFR